MYGAGIALEIGNKVPDAKKAYLTKYKRFCDMKQEMPLGMIWQQSGVIHLVGQHDYERDGKRHTNYGAVAKGFNNTQHLPLTKPQTDSILGIPKGFGCGLSGAEWDIMLELIEQCLAPHWRAIYIFEL